MWTATDKNMDYDKAKETGKSAKKESKLVRRYSGTSDNTVEPLIMDTAMSGQPPYNGCLPPAYILPLS